MPGFSLPAAPITGDIPVFGGGEFKPSGSGVGVPVRIVGKQAVYATYSPYGWQTQEGRRLTILDGSSTAPVTDGESATVQITRYSAITSGLNRGATFNVTTIGDSSETVQPVSVLGQVQGNGLVDCVGVLGDARYTGAGTFVAIGGYFQAEARASGSTGGANAVGTATLNYTGRNEAYNASPATFTGIDLFYSDGAASSKYAGAAVRIRASEGTGGKWDAGIYFQGSPVNSFLIASSVFAVTNNGFLAVGSGTAPTAVFGSYTPMTISGASGATIDFQVAGVTKDRITADVNAMYLTAVSAISFNVSSISGTGNERMRLANWTPAANQTALYLHEGVTPTQRQVQWVDPGAAGVNLVAGQKVMVLV